MKFKHLFGPVPSRRLGISLGVDLVPHKVCSQDCIYCEVGKTTNLTDVRKEYVPVDEVIYELDNFLSSHPVLDFITFSGAGEPTLNIGLERIIDFLKKKYSDYKLALITNSNLLTDRTLRDALNQIDVILPSLDAASDDVFEKINKPCKSIHITEMIEALAELSHNIKGEMWLEIFLLPGYNDNANELQKIKDACEKISPDKIQLNTLDRPGVESELIAMPVEGLQKIKDFLMPLPVEIIAKAAIRKQTASYKGEIADMIIQTISRRPCTDQDLCSALGLHINEVNKYLGSLLNEGKIKKTAAQRGIFFEPAQKVH